MQPEIPPPVVMLPTHVGMNRTALTLTYRARSMLPTHVGMNREGGRRGVALGHAPHTRGDEPTMASTYTRTRKCSPHTWG